MADSPLTIRVIQALETAATPGPWVVEIEGGVDDRGEGWRHVEVGFVGAVDVALGHEPGLMLGDHENADVDAAFIAAARTAVPSLLSALDEARAERDMLGSRLIGEVDKRCDAETEVGRLRAQVEAVEALHFTRGRNILGRPVCNECSPLQPMPCPTLRALGVPYVPAPTEDVKR